MESKIITGLGHDFNKINYFKFGGELCNDGQFNFLSDLLSSKKQFVDQESLRKLVQIICDGDTLKRDIPGNHASILINWLKNNPNKPIPDLPIIYGYNDQMPLGMAKSP